ncbi:alpha/beta fold hydrolase [Anaeromyxobacter sp. PSR-1]|uniref:alpha/beta fold hydrolase n=1 Tax=unclassified Anaeromyxobacter TaxID=2620896 RepID=UPI002351EDA4|nr:alpha/beta fold hydrolase [Anaeromyxobacter sp. PSR-1]
MRLVALDRPGLGRSDPDPGRTLRDWARDVGEVVAARGLRPARIVGFSQGAPFALACAAAGVVEGAAIVSGSDELAAPHLAERLVPDVRGLVRRVAADPEGAAARFRTMNAERMRGMVLAASGEADRAVYAEPRFDAAYRRALDEGFAQGADGYAVDARPRHPPVPARAGGVIRAGRRKHEAPGARAPGAPSRWLPRHDSNMRPGD